MNLYAYVGNNPVNWVDPWGLELLICGRRVRDKILKPFFANHAYILDSETGRWMGRGGSKTESPKNDACNVIGDPENIQEIFEYFKNNKDNGLWFPWLNDCHTAIDKTLKHFGLPNTGAPGGRFGKIPNKGRWQETVKGYKVIEGGFIINLPE